MSVSDNDKGIVARRRSEGTDKQRTKSLRVITNKEICVNRLVPRGSRNFRYITTNSVLSRLTALKQTEVDNLVSRRYRSCNTLRKNNRIF